MVRDELLKKLSEHRGQLLVEVINFNDSFFVQAVKSDLMHVLRVQFHPNEETGFTLDESGYFGKDFEA